MAEGTPGRVALVTGGAQGLGLATVERLATDGFRVVLADLNARRAEEEAERLVARGLDVVADTVDVGSDASVAECFGRLPRLDVLVNNAGIISRVQSEEIDSSGWEREIAVNLGGTMRCSRAAYPLLIRSSAPAIVNLASVGSTFGLPHRLAYSTAKTGVVGLTRTLAAEWGKKGIRVNAVAPGYMQSPMMLSGLETGVLDRDRLLSRTPLMRFGRAEEVASVISFLASSDASFVTGVVLEVDGGITIDGTFHADDSYKEVSSA